MRNWTIVALLACAVGGAWEHEAALGRAGARLVRTVVIPHDARDASGMTEEIPGAVPHNRLGGLGSAIDHVHGDEYVMLPDRGPIDGASPYATRVERLRLGAGADGASFEVVSTVLLTDASGRTLTGAASAIDRDDPFRSLRYDPEGLRILPSGNVLISEEYGPHIDEFGSDGRTVRRLAIPEAFVPERFGARIEDELPPGSRRGRQPNRGLEGLAITPSGKVYAILQSPLIQDHGVDEKGKRVGVNIRVLEIDPETGGMRQFVYALDGASYGVSEILAVDETRFLVIERDGKAGSEARFKRIMLADFEGATDVSAVPALGAGALGDGIVPAKKDVFLDLLAPEFGLGGDSFPEKVEGLCFGPDDGGGGRLLVVTTDNDFGDRPTMVWMFACGAEMFERRR